MPGPKQRKSVLEFTGEMNVNVSKLLVTENEVILNVNGDMEVLGKFRKRTGNTKKGDTLTSSTSTSTSTTTSTSSSTSTSTTTTSTSTT